MMERMAVLKVDFEGTSHLKEGNFCKGQRKKMLHVLRRCLRVNTERKQRKSEERVY